MKYLLLIALTLCTLSVISFSQNREISREEYSTAEDAWTKARVSSYPRRETTFIFGGRIEEFWESATTSRGLIIDKNGNITDEEISINNRLYSRRKGGDWTCEVMPISNFDPYVSPNGRRYLKKVKINGIIMQEYIAKPSRNVIYSTKGDYYEKWSNRTLIDQKGRPVRVISRNRSTIEYDIPQTTITAPLISTGKDCTSK